MKSLQGNESSENCVINTLQLLQLDSTSSLKLLQTFLEELPPLQSWLPPAVSCLKISSCAPSVWTCSLIQSLLHVDTTSARDDQTSVCQFCTEGDHKNHSTVSVEVARGEKKTQLIKTQAEVQQMIQDRLKKIEEIKHSVKLNKKISEEEKADGVEVFRALLHCIERSQAELLEVMEEKQKAAEKQAEEFIKELEQEITELKRRDTELERLSHTEDHLHLLQVYPFLCSPPPTKNWTEVRINTHLRAETLRRALSRLQEEISKEMEKFVVIELKAIQQYAVDVTLDPDTANPFLILSDDGKRVTHGNKQQKLPKNPKRFDLCDCVLGKEGFSSGRFYYEVQVSGKTEWDFGVAKGSIRRKGDITLSPEDGYWTVSLSNETKYEAVESTCVPLSLKQAPQKVGVFVDYEEGLVSFYDVEARSHIYSFTGQSFTEKLYPYFSPCDNDGDVSGLFVYDRQAFFNVRISYDLWLKQNFEEQTVLPPHLVTVPAYLWRAPAPQGKKRTRKRGKRGGVLLKLKAPWRHTLPEYIPGCPAPQRPPGIRWILPVFPAPPVAGRRHLPLETPPSKPCAGHCHGSVDLGCLRELGRCSSPSSELMMQDYCPNSSPDELLSLFDSICMRILDSMAPLALSCAKPALEPWLNDHTRELRCVCRRAEHKWKKDRLQASLQVLNCVREYQKAVTSVKSDYY
ncbi:hypothetical protein SRHO_G00031680 [Serrasalmus rhombeus]